MLKPDVVVLDIDETDLGDDYLRYRDLIIRDSSGRNIGVRASELRREFTDGLVEMGRYPLYTV